MSKFIEHNSSGWNGSGRTSKNINVHQSKSSGNAESNYPTITDPLFYNNGCNQFIRISG